MPEPSGFMRRMVAYGSPRSHMLHGAPTGTYSRPSGPNRMNFHPWCRSLGSLSVTTTGAPAFSSFDSMLSKRMMRLISATYSAPSRNATPLGMFRSPLMIVITRSALPSLLSSRSAYTLPAFQVPANTVPPGLCASDRTLFTPSAHTEI